jgi:hypothetical protein
MNNAMNNEYLELIKNGGVVEIEHFINQYGEELIVYKMVDSENYFLTGREFDWEIGLKITMGQYPIVEGHLLNDDERNKIKAIIDKNS